MSFISIFIVIIVLAAVGVYFIYTQKMDKM